MRAFLAVAVLAVAQSLSEETLAAFEALGERYGNFYNIDNERWSDDDKLALLHLRLKVDTGEGRHVLSEGDIDLIIKGLDELPVVRGDILEMIGMHIGAYKTLIEENHAANPQPARQAMYDDPLMSRLRGKKTFEWLLDFAARERDRCAVTRVQKTTRMCEFVLDQLAKLFLLLLTQTGFDPARHQLPAHLAFDSLVDSHAAEIMEAFQFASAHEANMARSLLFEKSDVVNEVAWTNLKDRVSSGEKMATSDVEMLLHQLEVPAERKDASLLIASYLSRPVFRRRPARSDPLHSRLWETDTIDYLLDLAMTEHKECDRAGGCGDDDNDFLGGITDTLILLASDADVHVDKGDATLAEINLLGYLAARGDDLLVLGQHRIDAVKARGHLEGVEMAISQVEILQSILRGRFGVRQVVQDLLELVSMATVVVLASLYVWKRRAPAHERAARELQDDLAPSARTRRGRVTDARVASVPVWATLFRAAVCCVALLHSVIVLNMEQNKKGTALIVVVVPFLSWNGIWTVFERFAPEGSIWGRVGADALMLLEMIAGYVPGRDSSNSIRTGGGFFILLGTGRLVYDSVGWLRRFVQKSGPGAGRAPQADERPSTGARASQQRGARPGLRKRANRGRRRDATPRAPEPDPPETQSENAAPKPKTSEPEPEPEPTRATDVQETVPEPTAPEPKVPEPEPEPAPVAESRAPSAAPVPEAKVEEPVVAPTAAPLEAKLEEPLLATEEPAAAPEGFEIVARVLEHLNEPHLLPIFVAEEINDNVLPCLDPSDLIGLGVSQMTCLTILGAAHSAAKNKKLETEDVLDNVAKHQSVLEEALREHREEIKRLRIRELPEDLMCPITCEIMKDPVLCVEDGHTYERVAVEQWFATGARTSPATSQHLESTALAPNHVVRKLIAALLEQHRG